MIPGLGRVEMMKGRELRGSRVLEERVSGRLRFTPVPLRPTTS
jgi:hypothetical protein